MYEWLAFHPPLFGTTERHPWVYTGESIANEYPLAEEPVAHCLHRTWHDADHGGNWLSQSLA